MNVKGPYAYVTIHEVGLQVIDINDPSKPVIVGSCNTLTQALDISVTGPYAYVTDGDNGLQIIHLFYPCTNISVSDPKKIMATVPSDLPVGNYDTVVTNLDGQSGSLSNVFRIKEYQAPVLNKVNDMSIVLGEYITFTVATGDTFALIPQVIAQDHGDTLSFTYSG
ncbi:MAG: hypothetical protein ACMUJM_16785 [bacterium]